jgi:hypothetical protein
MPRLPPPGQVLQSKCRMCAILLHLDKRRIKIGFSSPTHAKKILGIPRELTSGAEPTAFKMNNLLNRERPKVSPGDAKTHAFKAGNETLVQLQARAKALQKPITEQRNLFKLREEGVRPVADAGTGLGLGLGTAALSFLTYQGGDVDMARKMLRELPARQARVLNTGIAAAAIVSGMALGIAGDAQSKRSKLNQALNECKSLGTESEDWFVTRAEAGSDLFDKILGFEKRLASAEDLAKQTGLNCDTRFSEALAGSAPSAQSAGSGGGGAAAASASRYHALPMLELIERFDNRARKARAHFDEHRATCARQFELSPEHAIASSFVTGAMAWTLATWDAMPFKAHGAVSPRPFALSALSTFAVAIPVAVYASQSQDSAWHARLYGEAALKMREVSLSATAFREKAEAGENVPTEDVLALAKHVHDAYNWTNGGKEAHKLANESFIQVLKKAYVEITS